MPGATTSCSAARSTCSGSGRSRETVAAPGDVVQLAERVAGGADA